MKSSFAFTTTNNCKDCEAFQKYQVHQQCNEDSAFKGMQKGIPLKLDLLHISKVIPCEPSKTSQHSAFKLSHQKKKAIPNPQEVTT
jgi:hypothetical protein